MSCILKILYLSAFFLLVSCGNVFHSDLTGKWQLLSCDKDGKTNIVDTVWYNFQSESLFMMQIYVPDCDTFIDLYGYRSQQSREELTIELVHNDYLPYAHWKQRERIFKIEKLNCRDLAIRSDEDELFKFIKY